MRVTSRDRFAAALRGEVADRPPVALWRHFPERDQSAPNLAAATLEWQRDFPGDFVKFMPPGDYPTIDWGLRSVFDGALGGTRRPIFHPVSEARDWERLPAIDVRTGFNAEILAAVGLTRRGLPDEVPLLQTLFSPLTVAAKLSDGAVTKHVQEAPAAVHAGLRRIVEVTRAFALASLAAGANGFFFATQLADRDRLDEAAYREFGVPYDLQIFADFPAETPLLLHFHGQSPLLDLADRYPLGALSWHDRRFGPSLAALRRGQTRPVAGGIDEEAIVDATPGTIAEQVADTLQTNDHRGLIVAPGCVIPVATPAENIRAAFEAAKVGDAT